MKAIRVRFSLSDDARRVEYTESGTMPEQTCDVPITPDSPELRQAVLEFLDVSTLTERIDDYSDPIADCENSVVLMLVRPEVTVQRTNQSFTIASRSIDCKKAHPTATDAKRLLLHAAKEWREARETVALLTRLHEIIREHVPGANADMTLALYSVVRDASWRVSTP